MQVYQVDLRRVVVSEQWSHKVGGLFIQVVSNIGLTVHSSKPQKFTLVHMKMSKKTEIVFERVKTMGRWNGHHNITENIVNGVKNHTINNLNHLPDNKIN